MAIWQHNKRVFSIFSPRMRRNGYLGTSSQKSDPAIRSAATSISYTTDALPLPSDVYWIYWCFCATTSHDLVTLTFDFLTLRVFRVQCFSCPTHTPTFIILRLSVTELRLLNVEIWSHFRYLKQSLRMRRVTWPLTGGKNSQHFLKSLTPICLFTLSLSGRYDED